MVIAVVLSLFSTLVSISATSSVDLATFTPLAGDSSRTSTAFFAVSSSQTSSPSACIDGCFNDATGSGKQGGCAGISGQYECICSVPAMMQDFQTCMSATCSLDSSTIQETLGNVQQICGSCTPDGCNTFSISGSANGGGTITFQAPSSNSPPTATAGASLCYSTTESVWVSSAGSLGAVVGSGFFSAGSFPCASSSVIGSSTPSAGVALSDAASPSGTKATGGASSTLHHFCVWAAGFVAITLGAALA
ncbi:hypothetical protein DFH06DRAFT_459446 [Mycena polygramma]|nr:hypothetical protein DFH06DRAFT_459446 [Mycena polygramma]